MHGTKSCLQDLLDKRWSTRSFSKEKLTDEEWLHIFEAGRQTASSYNEQPWSFILASEEDAHYQKLFNCLGEFNQSWCKTAPYLAVALGRKHFAKNNEENPHRFHDVGAFLAVAALRATELGFFMHQMAGFSPERVKKQFDIPEDYEPITMFVFGKHGNSNQLPPELQERENPDSERKEIKEFLFGEKWGKAYSRRVTTQRPASI